MSSNATGDSQPEPAVIADEPAPAGVADATVAAGMPEGPAEGAVEVSPGDEQAARAAVAGTAAQAGGEADLDGAGDAGRASAADCGDAGSDGTGPERAGTEGTGPGDTGQDDPHDEALALAADGDDGSGPGDSDGDPAELIEFSEPVERAEPVEEFRPGRRWPRILLAAGFLMAAAAIVVGAIAIVSSLTHGFKKPVKVTYKKSALFSLKTGDCLDPQGQSYTLISCGSPHEAEVFATFKLHGTKWPGSTAAAAAASGGCATRLSGYLNPELAISLASTYVYPDAVAWRAGTRTVICEVRASSGQLTGSVRGASATAS